MHFRKRKAAVNDAQTVVAVVVVVGDLTPNLFVMLFNRLMFDFLFSTSLYNEESLLHLV